MGRKSRKRGMRKSKGRLANMSKMSTADRKRVANVRTARFGRTGVSVKDNPLTPGLNRVKSDLKNFKSAGGGFKGILSALGKKVKSDVESRGVPPGGPGGKSRSKAKKNFKASRNIKQKQGTTKDNVKQHGKSLKGNNAANYQSNKLIKG